MEITVYNSLQIDESPAFTCISEGCVVVPVQDLKDYSQTNCY